MSDNEIQKKAQTTRKTLSLRGGGKSESHLSNGKVSVEIKKRRHRSFKKDLSTSRHGDVNSDNKRYSAKLTDDEFKARVRALQNMIKAEHINKSEREIATFKNDAPNETNIGNSVKKENISASKPVGKNDEERDDKNRDNKNIEKSNDEKIDLNKKNEDKNLIDRLIKLAPKNKPAQKEPLKLVVFRGDGFVKENRFQGSRSNDPNSNKSEKVRYNRRSGTGKDLGIVKRHSNDVNNWSGKQDRKNIENKTPNSANITKKPQHQKKYEQSNMPTNTPFKKQQQKFKSKSSNDDKFDNFKAKSEPSRFSKRDLVRAINEDDNLRQRSIASINRTKQKSKVNSAGSNKKIVREVIIPDSISVGELASRMSVRASEVVKFLMSVGTVATVNQNIDGETAEIVCTSLGHIAKRRSESDFEHELDYRVLDTDENMTPRAPIVAVMGHVDHGKTTLLDTLRKASVTKKEAGGITQHVAAYQVETQKGKSITFIDTPGHEAFSKIRERGASITDIIVLVVAADDGIKEQTIEVIKEAKKNCVPLVVAINKIDKPDVNVEKVKSDLMQHDVLLESFGGDVLSSEISARNNINIDKLLDSILLQAEVLDLKANADRKATCTVIEARVEKGRGIVASVIVTGGTLKLGDVFVAGSTYGKIRTMTDCYGKRLKECKPAVPVELTGFDKTPEPGDLLVVVEDVKKAHEISERRNEIKNKKHINKISIKNIDEAISNSDSEKKTLNVYIKADVYGSLEAIESALLAIKCPEIKVSIAGKNIGIVSENDVDFAKASNAIIVCFNVGISSLAKNTIKRLGVKVINNNIIYHLINDVIGEIEKLLPPVVEEKYSGRAVVKKIFVISKIGTIAGCVVTDGVIKRNNSKIKVIRNNKVVYEGGIKSMKHEKDEIKECGVNHECGILTEGFSAYAEKDIIECFDVITTQRKLN